MRKCHDFCFFNLWLNRRQADSVSCVLLVEVCEENLASHKYAAGKGRSLLTAFSENFGFSSLILHQKSTSGSFIKVSWNMEPKTLSVIFWTWLNSNILVYFVL